MSRTRRVAGIVAGVLILLSAVAHSVFGGAAMQKELAAAHVPEDLLRGALVGWEFGGAAMLAFSLIVLYAFARPAGSSAVQLAPVRVVAATYLLFGAAALAVSDFDPFFLVFVVPGLLLAGATWPHRATSPAG